MLLSRVGCGCHGNVPISNPCWVWGWGWETKLVCWWLGLKLAPCMTRPPMVPSQLSVTPPDLTRWPSSHHPRLSQILTHPVWMNEMCIDMLHFTFIGQSRSGWGQEGRGCHGHTVARLWSHCCQEMQVSNYNCLRLQDAAVYIPHGNMPEINTWKCHTQTQCVSYSTWQQYRCLYDEAQEGSPLQVTRSLFFKAPGHQVTFFHEKIKTTQVTGRFFKLSRSRGRPQNGPRSQVANPPSWASYDAPAEQPEEVWYSKSIGSWNWEDLYLTVTCSSMKGLKEHLWQ